MKKGYIKPCQLQIGKNIRLELQIPFSLKRNFRGSDKILRTDGGMIALTLEFFSLPLR
jgi:hypothetical protein